MVRSIHLDQLASMRLPLPPLPMRPLPTLKMVDPGLQEP
jgi:hypothetical protein